MTLDQFESLVFSQQPARVPWRPVTDYSFEARTAIEGPHAQIILDTFRPTGILDVGCGPGHLVRMLNDRAGYSVAAGADLEGVDADYTLDVAAADRPRLGRRDLVICREVLEHLTVMQIRRAVTNLCLLASRYVYLTTRFHPAPASLIDVATSDDLDPTHITMLHPDLLRLLFVLEGFRRCPAHEAAMDWKGLGRVLVYERATRD